MKLQKDKQLAYDSNMSLEGYDAKISQNDIHKLWDLLQNPYKNPIGAIVREYVSNSFDAHAEANYIKNHDLHSIRNEYSIYHDSSDEELIVLKENLAIFDDDAVVVTVAKDDTGYYWSTEDFGIGLSMERVKDVFCSYLSSTKENSNNVIGAFGIGSKSGLSYADVVHIRTRYNGIEYLYFLRKGEKQPRLDLFSKEDTNERNGTEIKIYIKEDRKNDTNDKHRFIDECKKQLVYFDNVYFRGDILNSYNSSGTYRRQEGLSNDYKIIRGGCWVKNDLNQPFKGLHLCLGKVAYPIDWDNLAEIDQDISLEVALKFEIGELDIIQTREDVKYTPRTKKAIIDRIAELRKEMGERWEKDKDLQTTDLIYYLDHKDSSPTLTYEGVDFDLSSLYKGYNYNSSYKDHLPWFEFLPFKEEGIKVPEHPFFDYVCDHYIGAHGLRKSSGNLLYLFTRKGKILYRAKDAAIAKKSKYIRFLEDDEDVYLIRKKSKYFFKLKYYVKELGLEWNDRINWRRKIKLYQDTITRSVLAATKSYDRVVVDKQWIKDNYGPKRTIDRTKIVAKQLLDYYVQGKNYSYHRAELIKYKIDQCTAPLKIIGVHEDRFKLERIAKWYESTTALQIPKNVGNQRKGNTIFCWTVAPTNMKYFNNVKNVITVEKFMNKENKTFTRIMTVYHFQKSEKYKTIRKLLKNYSSKQLNKIYTPLSEDFKFLENFIRKYKGINSRGGWNNQQFFIDSCYEMAKENNLFDSSFNESCDRITKYFNGLELLDYVNIPDGQDFPYLAIAKYIRDFNRASRNRKSYKRINPCYYVIFNDEELQQLSANKEEYEFKTMNNLKLKENETRI